MNPYQIEILIICKSSTRLSFTLNFLGKQGYRVNGATGYLDAIKKIEKINFDLVVFFEEMEEKEKDHVENIASFLRHQLQFLHFSEPVQKLPAHINRLVKEEK
ncbi:MAG: hypothetical protein KFF73_13235 [Cyclobacteriaceae bacterium]|nr:hypothetical protein [Cyclobacteriaceae bacterium]